MDFEKLKKELQDILAHYHEALGMVDREKNTFVSEFSEEIECDGYVKLVELIEKCHSECQSFIYYNIPEEYLQEIETERIDDDYYHYRYDDEDSYGYHQRHPRQYRGYYDEEGYESIDDGELEQFNMIV